MALYNINTKKTYSFEQGSWAPSGSDWKWKYTGDIIDRHLWRMKKEATKEQERINILNKWSNKVKNGEVTAIDIVNMVNSHNVPVDDVKVLGSETDLACYGVQNGHIWENVIGKSGWPTLKYVYTYISDNFYYRDGGDIDACYTDENDMKPEEIYGMIDSAVYQNNLGRADYRFRNGY